MNYITEPSTMKKETGHSCSLKEKIRILKYLGEIYRAASLRVDLFESELPNSPQNASIHDDQLFLYQIDRALLACRPQTQWLIRKAFLENNDPTWYLEFVSKTTFRRIRERAVIEFFGILDLKGN